MLHCVGDDYPRDHDDIDSARDRVGHQFGQPLDTALGVSVVDNDVVTFLVPQLTQALLKTGPRRAIATLSP